MGMEKGSGLNFGPYDYNGGGGNPQPPTPTPQGEYFVKVIDYDGTVLDEQWLDDGAEYTLPANPDRTDKGLVFQEWSCTQDIVNGKVTIDKNNVLIGAIYTTVSGQNEFDIELTKGTGLTVRISMNGTKDWGDGTSDTQNTHTYTDYGEYTIKCNGTTLTNTEGSNNITGGATNYYQYQTFYLKRIRFATVQTIKQTALQGFWGLELVTFSTTTTDIHKASLSQNPSLQNLILPKGTYTILPSCYGNCSLKHIVIPKGITKIDTNSSSVYSLQEWVFPKTLTSIDSNYCFSTPNFVKKIIFPENVVFSNSKGGMFGEQYQGTLAELKIPDSAFPATMGSDWFRSNFLLKEMKIPDTVTSIGSYTFGSCGSLRSVTLSKNLTSIPMGCFNACYCLEKIVIPEKVASVETYAFSGCNSLVEYDFSKVEVIPTLANTNAFGNINKRAVIKVPSALYDQWITETNWSALADYIVAV